VPGHSLATRKMKEMSMTALIVVFCLVLPFAAVSFWQRLLRHRLPATGSDQPIQWHTASSMTSSRSRPFSHGSSSVNKVTHCRQEHGIRVIPVPQNIRSGPKASKQRCRCGCRLRNGYSS